MMMTVSIASPLFSIAGLATVQEDPTRLCGSVQRRPGQTQPSTSGLGRGPRSAIERLDNSVTSAEVADDSPNDRLPNRRASGRPAKSAPEKIRTSDRSHVERSSRFCAPFQWDESKQVRNEASLGEAPVAGPLS